MKKKAKPAPRKKSVARKQTNSGNNDKALREHVVYLLKGGGAHVHFMDAVEGFPEAKRGTFIAGLPHTGWQLLEHSRIAQWDILEFSRNAKHVSPGFPEGYWPKTPGPADAAAWDKSVEAFQRDLEEIVSLVNNPKTDLCAKIPHGDGQTILREALLLADHNAYHLGQLVDLRRALGEWPTP
ncbi:MAG: ABC transporter [Acidobacteria bacterium]|nr:MAG: ABC transporter [Acidobacteriota bacterium]